MEMRLTQPFSFLAWADMIKLTRWKKREVGLYCTLYIMEGDIQNQNQKNIEQDGTNERETSGTWFQKSLTSNRPVGAADANFVTSFNIQVHCNESRKRQ